MTPLIRRFLIDERGATSIEYGLIGGLIFLAILGGLSLIDDPLNEIFDRVSSRLAAAVA